MQLGVARTRVSERKREREREREGGGPACIFFPHPAY